MAGRLDDVVAAPDEPVVAVEYEHGQRQHRDGIPVRSPVDGRVLRVLKESETVVQAGEPLVEIGDPKDLEIVVDLPSNETVRIAHCAPVVIEAWGGESALSGRVRRIEPSAFTKVSALGIEEQRVNVLIDLDDPPHARPALQN